MPRVTGHHHDDVDPPTTVSVVVPTYGRPDSLARCLTALAAQSRAPEQVVVACRADDRLTLEALADLSELVAFDVVTTDAPRLTRRWIWASPPRRPMSSR